MSCKNSLAVGYGIVSSANVLYLLKLIECNRKMFEVQFAKPFCNAHSRLVRAL